MYDIKYFCRQRQQVVKIMGHAGANLFPTRANSIFLLRLLKDGPGFAVIV
jgi:hypothetical protein